MAAILGIVCSGIGGLIVNYGWSKAADVQIVALCKSVDKLEGSVSKLFKITAENSLVNIQQKEQILGLKERITDLVMEKSDKRPEKRKEDGK